MKLYHRASMQDTYHEIDFTDEYIIVKKEVRREVIEESRKTHGVFSTPEYRETYETKEIDVLRSYVTCSICHMEIFIREKDISQI